MSNRVGSASTAKCIIRMCQLNVRLAHFILKNELKYCIHILYPFNSSAMFCDLINCLFSLSLLNYISNGLFDVCGALKVTIETFYNFLILLLVPLMQNLKTVSLNDGKAFNIY